MFNFFKYSGSGNDFILSEEFLPHLPIQVLCDRKRGIGADGLLLVKREGRSSFQMRIYNADGSEAEMCGNGLRSVFYHLHHRFPDEAPFEVHSLLKKHRGFLMPNGEVKIEMGDPEILGINQLFSPYTCDWIDTGVPHLILKTEPGRPFLEVAPFLRHHPDLPKGANVNFLTREKNSWKVTTYERGVEGITEACGTGVTASALSLSIQEKLPPPFSLLTVGGDCLTVNWEGKAEKPKNLTLQGPVSLIFEGKLLASSL